jgi:hypothetical protein
MREYDKIDKMNLKWIGGGGLKMLKTGRLKPSVTGGGAVEKILGVLSLVVNAGSTTRSKSLSPSTVHL